MNYIVSDELLPHNLQGKQLDKDYLCVQNPLGDGWVFDEHGFHIFLTSNSLRIVSTNENNGMYTVRLEEISENSPEMPNIFWKSEPENSIILKEAIANGLKDYMRDHQGMMIRVRGPLGKETKPYAVADDSAVDVVLWSVPRKSILSKAATRETPSNVCGHPLNRSKLTFYPSGLGTEVLDENGMAVAEVIGKTIYVLYPVKMTNTDASIIETICRQSAQHINDSVVMTEIVDMSERNSYAEMMSSTFHRRRQSLEETVTHWSRKVEQLQVDLRKAIEMHEVSRIDLENINSKSNSVMDKLKHEYDLIMGMKKVKDVRVTADGKLRIETELLKCRNPSTNRLHAIGCMEFIIDIKNTRIRVFNLTNTCDDKPAPHVGSDGIMCQGTLSEMLPVLFGRSDYVSMVELLIGFVETVNIDDPWGKTITKWPEVRE